ncbi:hypothetical protein, partial [Anaerotruncus colihominis]|uniref:hypothetical protein n=1 Tax=Anaerotruncus colihominis TaxID=169435 RepID=UPI003516D1D4
PAVSDPRTGHARPPAVSDPRTDCARQAAPSKIRDRRCAAGADFAIPRFPKEKARDNKAVTGLFF